MNTQSVQASNNVYLLNPELDHQQLVNAISACLCKAEALALTAATTDFETYDPDIINNYMWALSDIIGEAKQLYGKTQGITPN